MPWSAKRRSGSATSAPSAKCSATRAASQRARSAAQTKFAEAAEDTCWWNHSANCSQTSDGSASSISCSASRPIERSRSRRSYSMSDCRSATPSLSVICQRGGALLELVGPALGPGQLGDQGVQPLRVLLHGQLGLHPGAQLLGHGQHVLAGGAAVQVVGPGHHPAQQELDQLPEAGLVEHRLVLDLGRQQPQRRGHREDLGPDVGVYAGARGPARRSAASAGRGRSW